MNIVKLKDIVIPETYSFAEFYNKNLKGKYAYWVKMRYIFSLDSIDYKTYIKYEQFNDNDFLKSNVHEHIDLYSEECNKYDFLQYIDQEITNNINTEYLNKYKIENDYVTDFDLDIEQLKNFRSWLASEILSFISSVNNSILSNEQIHMLEYYKNDMYNEVVKQLTIFGKDLSYDTSLLNSNSCCCKTNTQNVLNNISASLTCNALDIYSNNLHLLMVKTFEDVNFWLNFNKKFIILFKKYIDNIIKTNLALSINTNSNLYISCSCSTSNSAENNILKNLSESLQYIIDDEYKGHKNFIYDSLHNFAEKLYDKMYWK